MVGLTQAGACFGLSAACCRTGFLLARRLTWLAAPTGLCMSIVFSSLGFMLQTLGFKDGHSVIVCTCAAVSSMVTGENAFAQAIHHDKEKQHCACVTCTSDRSHPISELCNVLNT